MGHALKTEHYTVAIPMSCCALAACGVEQAEAVLKRIAQAMSEVLEQALTDERIPRRTFNEIAHYWIDGMAYVSV